MTAADALTPDRNAADRPRTARTGGRRSTIYSARYRLTLKGPDRGKWEDAQKVLKSAADAKGGYVYRADAQALLTETEKHVPKEPKKP